MSKKRSSTKSKKFEKLLGEYTDKGKKIKVYQDGNQIYFVKEGTILQNMTMHVDDIENLMALLDSIIELKENETK